MRQKIGLETNQKELAAMMSEGNPGALSVICQIMKDGPMEFMMTILDLDDMNIRGSQIWLGYKDHCEEDIEKFIECVKGRDKDMVETINREPGERPRAVTSGASFTR